MEPKTNYPKELCTDEAVCFIAERHRVTPQQLLHSFLVGEYSSGIAASDNTRIYLESNEIEILKGLSDTIKD